MANNRKYQNKNWVLILGILILIGSIWSLVDNVINISSVISSGNIGFVLGRFMAIFGFILLGGYCIFAYSEGLKSYDNPQPTTDTATNATTDKATGTSTPSKDDEAISDIQTKLIKLGFKSINHIDISDKDLIKLPQGDINRYYSAGKRVLKRGRL